jgi:hypothetical protein
MEEERIKELLADLARASAEQVDPALAERAKQQIAAQVHSRSGRGPLKIVINLQISRWAAAAVIIVVLAAAGLLLTSRGSSQEGFLSELKYSFVDSTALSREVAASIRDMLYDQGKDPVYYRDTVGDSNPDAVLMHWKLENGNYNVIFADYRYVEVTPEELIRLQSDMLSQDDGGR